MKWVGAVLAAGAAAVVGGAVLFTAYHSDPQRSASRRWVLNYEKGTYSGRTEAPIGEEAELKLRERALHQAGLSSPGFSMSTSSFGLAGADVRPPTTRVDTPIVIPAREK